MLQPSARVIFMLISVVDSRFSEIWLSVRPVTEPVPRFRQEYRSCAVTESIAGSVVTAFGSTSGALLFRLRYA